MNKPQLSLALSLSVVLLQANMLCGTVCAARSDLAAHVRLCLARQEQACLKQLRESVRQRQLQSSKAAEQAQVDNYRFGTRNALSKGKGNRCRSSTSSSL
jgi:hypothetical protein